MTHMPALLAMLGWLALGSGQVVAATVRLSYDLPGNLTAVQSTSPAVPAIVAQPVSAATEAGGAVCFTVSATSASAVTYQWKFNGNDIPGATGDVLLLPSVTLANEGSYTVVITNAQGSTTSAAGVLSISDPPEVIAWGYNEFGQVVVPAGLIHVKAVATGGNHSLALKSDGTVVAWGRNNSGEATIPGSLSGVVAIAAGTSHSLALKSDGTVVAWGSNTSGQTTIPGGLNNVVAIAAGNAHSLALKSDGTVVAWGENADGQTTIPSGLINVVAIAAGHSHNLAVRSDGTVTAWGSNHDPNVNEGFGGQTTIPAGLSGVVAVSAGNAHSVALKSDGTVVAWGANTSVFTTFAHQAVVPAGLNNVVAIAAGSYHTLALKSDGTVVAWGDHGYGQSIVPPPASDGIVAIGAGGSCSMLVRGDELRVAQPVILNTAFAALALDSSVSYQVTAKNHATSYNATGLPPGLSINTTTGLITGTPTATGTFVVTLSATNAAGTTQTSLTLTVNIPLPGITSSTVATADAGSAFNYQITASNSPTSFNATGLPPGLSINTGTGLISGTPTDGGAYMVTLSATNAFGTSQLVVTFTIDLPVPEITNPLTAEAFTNYSFILQITTSAGNPAPTSYNATGLPSGLGINTTTGSISGTPTVTGTFTVTLSATNGYGTGTATLTLNVVNYAEVVAWGYNNKGQATVPPGLGNVIAVAGGLYHSLALKSDGTVVAWGNDDSFHQHTIPAGLNNVVAVCGGEYNSYALKSDGTVVEWGSITPGGPPAGLTNVVGITSADIALKSDGTVVAWGSATAGETPPAGLSGVIAISGVDNYHHLALKANGTVGAWGYNFIANEATVPAGLSGVVAIAAGASHNLALKSDGTVVAWGSNGNGQATVPVGLSNVVAVAAGVQHSLALKADGTVVAWGYNNNGQTTLPLNLGNNVAAIAAGSSHSLALMGIEPSVPQPVILNSTFALAGTNEAFTYRIRAQNSPTSYAATGLPAGLALDTSTGVITGAPTASGTFTVGLSATNASGTGTRSLTLTVLAIAPPTIVVQRPAGTNLVNGSSTVSFGETITGTSASVTITIKNTGESSLTLGAITIDGANSSEFSVTSSPTSPVTGPNGSTTFTVGFNPTILGTRVATLHIASNDTANSPFNIGLTGLGSLYRSIGPDAFGYTATSNTPYAFTDISGTGTAILDNVNDSSAIIPIGFNFGFYGTARTTAYISSNCSISFNFQASGSQNVDLTSLSLSQPVICPLWDDWYTNKSTTDKVYHLTSGSPGNRVFTVQWHLNPSSGGAEITLQCRLFESTGQILLNYADVTSSSGVSLGQSATVGIQDTGGNANGRVLQWSYNQAVLADATSILINPPGIATTPQSWRQAYFGTTSNTGNAADLFDFDKDGLANIIEFAFGLNPTLGSSNQLPVGQIIGGNYVISFNQLPGLSGITFGAEWSTTLFGNDWHAIIDTGAGYLHTFSVPAGGNTQLFVRLKVTGQ